MLFFMCFFLLIFRQTELSNTPIAKSSSDQQPFLHHSDSTKTNNTDISEGSTNTEDYITCTDASKRGIHKRPSVSSSSTTQVPGSNPIIQLGFGVFDVVHNYNRIINITRFIYL